MGNQRFPGMEGRQLLGTSMRLYCHLFSGYKVTWLNGMILMRRILARKSLERPGMKAVKGFPMLIWKEKMNVGFAWSPAPKWSCLIAVMKCASTVTVIGTQNQNPAPFAAVA